MTQAKATQTPVEYEDISDDEQTSHEDRIDDLRILLLNTVADTGNILDTQSYTARAQTRRVVRSIEARQRRNRKRNLHLRPFRDRHVRVRPLFHRFTMKQIKQLLPERDVRYVHLKADRRSNYLSIGMKKSDLVGTYFDRVPGDMFNEHNYRLCRDRERNVLR